jgi:hypothetical protein
METQAQVQQVTLPCIPSELASIHMRNNMWTEFSFFLDRAIVMDASEDLRNFQRGLSIGRLHIDIFSGKGRKFTRNDNYIITSAYENMGL